MPPPRVAASVVADAFDDCFTHGREAAHHDLRLRPRPLRRRAGRGDFAARRPGAGSIQHDATPDPGGGRPGPRGVAAPDGHVTRDRAGWPVAASFTLQASLVEESRLYL